MRELVSGPASGLRFVLDMLSVCRGVIGYCLGNLMSQNVRMAIMRLHCTTNARSSDFLASLLRTFSQKRRPSDAVGVIGELSVRQQDAIVSAIARDGYYVFEGAMPAEWCGQLEKLARETPAMLEGRGASSGSLALFDPANPESKTYRLREKDIVANVDVQKLMADAAILAIAERYIGAIPRLSMVNLWWSATFGEKPGSDAAQEFHFDFDPPPKWLLFFVYLVDVDATNGPHVFVRGSHISGNPAAAKLLRRSYVRIPDDDIEMAFGSKNVVEIHGCRGTILAVDTRGFHKGKLLTSGHRLMMQLTFSYPLFKDTHGGVEPLNQAIHPELSMAAKSSPHVFARYFPRGKFS